VDLVVEGARVRWRAARRRTGVAASASSSTTGTFLRGLLHVGLFQRREDAGGEAPSQRASAYSCNWAFAWVDSRPEPRRGLLRTSVDLRVSTDSPVTTLRRSFRKDTENVALPAGPLATSPNTNESASTHLVPQSRPLTSVHGRIAGAWPRYCPSLEDKVVRFARSRASPTLPRARGTRIQLSST
jgi:tRNA uridine 5-carboxymethylaminomethyl modification enzyme